MDSLLNPLRKLFVWCSVTEKSTNIFKKSFHIALCIYFSHVKDDNFNLEQVSSIGEGMGGSRQ